MKLDVLEAEFADADLGDARLNRRAALVLKRWSAAPAQAFPKIAADNAQLQGLYGLMSNPSVEHTALLEAHIEKTRERVAQWGEHTVLVLHDTTTFVFGGGEAREGLGWVSQAKQGFHGHFSLAVSSDGTRGPLGVIALQVLTPTRRPGSAPRQKPDGKKSSANPERDNRWRDGIDQANERLRGIAVPLHVMDRAGDSYETFATMSAKGQRYLVRSNYDRCVTETADKLATPTRIRAVAERAVPVTAREVQLGRRKSSLPTANKRHPPRSTRNAVLEFAADRVRLYRAKHLDPSIAASVDVNIIHVREIEPPTGFEPVDWLLITSESIETEQDILRVVDAYRARWTIEEFFKAIKTGCSYEKRQLESAHALLNALALCIPIAWQMLALRHQSRHNPHTSANHILDETQLAVLRAISRLPLPTAPTVEDVTYAIAALGGHIKRNGLPGWQTLAKGLYDLLLVEIGWKAARADL